MDWTTAHQRATKLRQRRTVLETQQTMVEQSRQRDLALSIDAQERIQAGDFVKEILERLQQREHERAVGAYEQLLGAFLSDVLPGERQIVMDLHTDRGAAALDIYIKKGENSPLEDAWLGTGGSVTNLLSTGLRLVALLRSGQRRFLVLDESDCWIKPDLIPQYASVVEQMAQELGVQILMISHHDESLFAQHIAHRLRLSKMKGGMLTAEWSPTSNIPQWDEQQKGLRSIGLKDFQSHQNTFIPLAPDVTLLQGDNDIGKSAVVNALRAVFDADANDTLIKHHAASAQVTLDFGPEHLLTWQRFRKGKVKTSYRLLNVDTQQVIHATDGTKVPEWLNDTLKIGQVEGLDIQIGQQQDPVFLLNQPASTRAKALSIGQESGHVNAMMLLDRQELADAKSTVKTCEKNLETARRQLNVFATLSPLEMDWEATVQRATQRQQQAEQALRVWRIWKTAAQRAQIVDVGPAPALTLPTPTSTAHRAFLARWAPLMDKVEILQEVNAFLPSRPVPLPRSEPVKALREKWKTVQKRVDVLAPLETAARLDIPHPTSVAHTALLERWDKAQHTHAVLAQLPAHAPTPPTLHAPSAWSAVAGKWSALETECTHLGHSIDDLEREEQRQQQALHDSFPACPTCQRSW